jgi:DNA-binding NarL/FixJ family response regulator
MPGIDGLQVTRALRELQPGCAILIVSAFEAHRLEAAALAAGADRYVEKAAGLVATAEAAAELAGLIP